MRVTRTLSFFHMITSRRQSNNFIDGIMDQNSLCVTDHRSIGQIPFHHFQQLFYANPSPKIHIDELPNCHLSEEQIQSLDSETSLVVPVRNFATRKITG